MERTHSSPLTPLERSHSHHSPPVRARVKVLFAMVLNNLISNLKSQISILSLFRYFVIPLVHYSVIPLVRYFVIPLFRGVIFNFSFFTLPSLKERGRG